MRDKKTDEAVDLGKWIGRRQAFALVAGRCSAADAGCIRKMRLEKTYLTLERSWERFCRQHLGVSRAWADRIIGQWSWLRADWASVSPARGGGGWSGECALLAVAVTTTRSIRSFTVAAQ